MFNDLRYELFILALRILLVQDAILLPLKVATPEHIPTILQTMNAVVDVISTIEDVRTKATVDLCDPAHQASGRRELVTEGKVLAKCRHVVEVVTLEHNVLAMLHVATFEALVAISHIAAVDEIITCGIRCIDIVDCAVGARDRKSTPLLFEVLLLYPRTIEYFLPSSLILLLPNFLVEDVVLLISQVDTRNAALAADAVE